MKRTKLKTGQVRYRCNAQSGFRLKDAESTIIKRNQVFVCYPEEVPAGFMDLVEVVDEAAPPAPPKPVKHTYSVENKGNGWFDVLDSEGKKLNSKGLREDEAKQMKKELEAL